MTLVNEDTQLTIFSLSPTYHGDNNDTFKGVPCKILIKKETSGDYRIQILKLKSGKFEGKTILLNGLKNKKFYHARK